MTCTLADVLEEKPAPGDLIGFSRNNAPIFLIAGGATDDDDDDDDIDIDSDDVTDDKTKPKDDKGGKAKDDDTDDDDDAEYTPPGKEEWSKVKRTLRKRNEEKKAAERELAELKAKNGSQSEQDAAKAKVEAAKERDSYWKPKYVSQAAKSAIVAAGYTGNNPARLVKLLDMDEIEVDEDGEIDGLDSQIRELKKEDPDLFKKRTPGKIDAGDKDDDDKDKGGMDATSRALIKQARGR